MCVCVCVCVYVCVYVCMCMRACVCKFEFECVLTYVIGFPWVSPWNTILNV